MKSPVITDFKMPAHGRIVIIKRSGQDGTSFPLLTDSCLIGRDKDCDIRVQLPNVSSQHCAIEVKKDGQIYLKQLSNASVTLLNGIVLKQERLMHHKDMITVVDRCFRFEYPVGSQHRTPASPYSSGAYNKTPKSSPLSLPSSAGRTPRPPPIDGITKMKLSPRTSPRKVVSSPQLRFSRKSVSFGPLLSPEQFHDEFPPSTPIKRGRQPVNCSSLPSVSNTRVLRLSLPQLNVKSTSVEKSPKAGHKRKLSPNSAALELSPLLNDSSTNSAKRKALSTSFLTPVVSSNKGAEGSSQRKRSLIPSSRSGLTKPTEASKLTTSLFSDSWSSISSGKSESSEHKSSDIDDQPNGKLSSGKRRTSKASKRRSSRASLVSGETGSASKLNARTRSSFATPKKGGSTSKRKQTPTSRRSSTPKVLLSRKTPTPKTSSSKKSRKSSLGAQIPKILAPDSPDSKKSKALITIHAAQLRSKIKGKTPKSQRKPLFTEMLKLGLMKNPPGSARKKKAARKLVSLAIKKRPPVRTYVSKTPSTLRKKKTGSTGHANSPETILIGRKALRTPKKTATPRSLVKKQRSLRKQSSILENTEISQNVTRDIFVSPLNTPKVRSVKKSEIMEQFLKDSNAAALGWHSSKSPNVGDVDSMHFTPLYSPEKSKRLSEKRLLAKNDSINVRSVKNMFNKKTPSSNYNNVKGLKRLLRTPKISPKADYTNVAGVKRLFRKSRSTPEANYDNVFGLKNLFRASNQSPKANYTNVHGMKNLFQSQQKSPKCDYSNVHGLKKLFNSPKPSPKADYDNVHGLRKLFSLPNLSPKADYTDVRGLKKLMQSSTPEADYRNVFGMKVLMKMQKCSPEVVYEGVKDLFSPPMAARSGSTSKKAHNQTPCAVPGKGAEFSSPRKTRSSEKSSKKRAMLPRVALSPLSTLTNGESSPEKRKSSPKKVILSPVLKSISPSNSPSSTSPVKTLRSKRKRAVVSPSNTKTRAKRGRRAKDVSTPELNTIKVESLVSDALVQKNVSPNSSPVKPLRSKRKRAVSSPSNEKTTAKRGRTPKDDSTSKTNSIKVEFVASPSNVKTTPKRGRLPKTNSIKVESVASPSNVKTTPKRGRLPKGGSTPEKNSIKVESETADTLTRKSISPVRSPSSASPVKLVRSRRKITVASPPKAKTRAKRGQPGKDISTPEHNSVDIESPVEEKQSRPQRRGRKIASSSPVKPKQSPVKIQQDESVVDVSSPKTTKGGRKAVQKERSPVVTKRTRGSSRNVANSNSDKVSNPEEEPNPKKKTRQSKKKASPKKKASKAIQKSNNRASANPTLSPVLELPESPDAAIVPKTTRTRGKAKVAANVSSPRPKRSTRQNKK